jgi:hypothetical protein
MLTVDAKIPFVAGWAGEAVKLGGAVPPTTGGLLDGQFAWSGYRWMKGTLGRKQFWDGSAWRDVPRRFRFIDGNYMSVGFYKQGRQFVCQHGGTWPGTFDDWNVEAPDYQWKLRGWTSKIDETWSGRFDIKRTDCKSHDRSCCRYRVRVQAMFVQQPAFDGRGIIVARGDIRSNASLFFLGDPQLEGIAHEFGHHLGNRDEYPGAETVDSSLNGDGAVNGIDEDSIMGRRMSKVKTRHFRTVAKAFGDAVFADHGETFTYAPILP